MAANNYSITGTSEIFIGALGNEVVSSVVFQVTAASSLSMVVKATLDDTANATANIQYINLLTGAVQSAGTAITANGIYGVFAPAMLVGVTPSAGSCTLDVSRIAGRVF